MRKLEGLRPEKVFYFFEELTKIPRGSGNELAVAKFIEQYALNKGFQAVRDEYHNVVVHKPAQHTDSKKTVLLQAHTDMVCVAREGYAFDFTKQAIPVKVEGDWVKTEGTTLGADNGIGASMMLAVLDDGEMAHPNLTCIFTATEETGMNGVIGLDAGHVKGDCLINIDTEEEGTIITSCSGGMHHLSTCKVTYDGSSNKLFKVSVGGLKGGHSGMSIGVGRANANKLLARTLLKIDDCRIATISGGDKMNAIPQYAEALIASERDLNSICESMQKQFRNEYQGIDDALEVRVQPVHEEHKLMSRDTVQKILTLLIVAPHGVQGMSASIHGLVETSLNLAMIGTCMDEFFMKHSIRSSVRSRKSEVADCLKMLVEAVGGTSSISAEYPEWQYREHSPLREQMKESWKKLYGIELKVDAIHAGLECGYLAEKNADLDMVSMGPTHHDVHTPDERVSISSVERVFAFLTEVLSVIK